MKWLDEEIFLRINKEDLEEPILQSGVYVFAVYRRSAVEELVFVGSKYINSADQYIDFHINDLITNSGRYNGELMIESITEDTDTTGVIATFRIELYKNKQDMADGESPIGYVTEDIMMAFRYPNKKLKSGDIETDFDNSGMALLLSGHNIDTHECDLLPRYPYIETENYNVISVFNGSFMRGNARLSLNHPIVSEDKQHRDYSWLPYSTSWAASLKNILMDSSMPDTYDESILDTDYVSGYIGITRDYNDKNLYTKVTPHDARETFFVAAYINTISTDLNNLGIIHTIIPESLQSVSANTKSVSFNIPKGLRRGSNVKIVLQTTPSEVYNTSYIVSEIVFSNDIPNTYVKKVDMEFYFYITAPSGQTQKNIILLITGVTLLDFLNDLNKIPTLSLDVKPQGLSKFEKFVDICLFDKCPARYYLQWQDRMGSIQSQPFNDIDDYSEEIETTEITTYYLKRNINTVRVQPKWHIYSGWIDEKLYRFYESIFVSKYVVLYDTLNDARYEVIVKSKNYEEKNFKNQDSLFNLDLELEGAKIQKIIY